MQDRQEVSLHNSISNFPDAAAAASANLTPSSRSGGSGVMEVFHILRSVFRRVISAAEVFVLTHAKVKEGETKMQVSTRFYSDAGFMLRFFHQRKHHFFVEEHRRQDINYTGFPLSHYEVSFLWLPDTCCFSCYLIIMCEKQLII